ELRVIEADIPKPFPQRLAKLFDLEQPGARHAVQLGRGLVVRPQVAERDRPARPGHPWPLGEIDVVERRADPMPLVARAAELDAARRRHVERPADVLSRHRLTAVRKARLETAGL